MRMISGAIGGMKIGKGNRSTRRKPAPATENYNLGRCFEWVQHLVSNPKGRIYIYRLRLCGKKMLRIFGPKMKKIIRDWIKLHNEDLYHLYPSPYIYVSDKTNMRWTGMQHTRRRDEKRIQNFSRETGREEAIWEK
jgi:hypothetical protein